MLNKFTLPNIIRQSKVPSRLSTHSRRFFPAHISDPVSGTRPGDCARADSGPDGVDPDPQIPGDELETYVQLDAANRVAPVCHGLEFDPIMKALCTYYANSMLETVTYGNGTATWPMSLRHGPETAPSHSGNQSRRGHITVSLPRCRRGLRATDLAGDAHGVCRLSCLTGRGPVVRGPVWTLCRANMRRQG